MQKLADTQFLEVPISWFKLHCFRNTLIFLVPKISIVRGPTVLGLKESIIVINLQISNILKKFNYLKGLKVSGVKIIKYIL